MLDPSLRKYVPTYMAKPFHIPDEIPECDRLAILTTCFQESSKNPEIIRIANGLYKLKAGMGPQSLLGFVQKIAFYPDPPGEWYQGVGYTLRRGGDCEDLASLLCAMYAAVGMDTRLVWLTQEGMPLNHITSQVYVEDDWQWSEPSIKGAKLGENPYAALVRTKDNKAIKK